MGSLRDAGEGRLPRAALTGGTSGHGSSSHRWQRFGVLSRRMDVFLVTREQRLRVAAQTAVDKVEAACGGRDGQAMFEALGECLTWICALDRSFELRADYRSRRNSDRHGEGQLLLGLRHARNTILHGDAVVGCRRIDRRALSASHPKRCGPSLAHRRTADDRPLEVRPDVSHTHQASATPRTGLCGVRRGQRGIHDNPSRRQLARSGTSSEVSTTICSAVSWLDRELAGP
jgi:hypothetical protein